MSESEDDEINHQASELLIKEEIQADKNIISPSQSLHLTMSDSEEDNEIRHIVSEQVLLKKHLRDMQGTSPHQTISDSEEDVEIPNLATEQLTKKEGERDEHVFSSNLTYSEGEMHQLVSDQMTEGQNENMTSMFASVWVKVEVDEDSAAVGNQSVDLGPKKKPSRRSREPLKCDLCDYKTIYKNNIKLHILRHSNIKPFACYSCDYTTKYPVSLQRHVLIQHELKDKKPDKDAPLHKCDQCEYTSYFYWNLNAHKRVHRKVNQFKCEDCSYETPYRHNYLKHKKRHNKQDVLYKCDKCPFETKFEGHISRHLAAIHNEVSDKANKCDYCDFSTTVKWRLNIHKHKNKQVEVSKCSHCEFETYYRCGAKKHKKQHFMDIYKSKTVENNDVIVEKPDLNKDFVFQNNHEKNNHYIVDPNTEVDFKSIQVIDSGKDQPFKCIQCQYSSKFKASVQRHFQRQHTDNQNRPYKCCNCDFSTKTKDQIALHNKRSQSSITLCCTECPFTTNFKCQFVMHQKLHYAHKCVRCNYVCRHKHDFHKHFMTVHMGEGLKCRFCDFKAIKKESLLVHETIHTGDKPFKCEHCDYKSVRVSLINKHMKRYHSEIKKDPVIFSYSKIETLKVVGGNAQKEIPIEVPGQQEYGMSMD